MKSRFAADVRKENYEIAKTRFKTQEEILMMLMADGISYSSEDLMDQLQIYNNSVPLQDRFNMIQTSVRRALHNLTKKGFIVEAGKKQGQWGKNITTYQLATQFAFF